MHKNEDINPLTLIGGGDVARADLDAALALAPTLVAADGGAQAAVDFGYKPEWVIGDLDSLSEEARGIVGADRVLEIAEQDSTDFEKCLRTLRARILLCVGFLGGRLDHQLAVLHAVARAREGRCILLGASEVVFHVPRKFTLDMARGDVVSLFPFAATSGRSEGLEWPIDNLPLAPSGMISTSNRALGRIVIETDAPGLLVILPRSYLNAVMQEIAGAF